MLDVRCSFSISVTQNCPTQKVSDGDQPPMTSHLSLSESAGSMSSLSSAINPSVITSHQFRPERKHYRCREPKLVSGIFLMTREGVKIVSTADSPPSKAVAKRDTLALTVVDLMRRAGRARPARFVGSSLI